MAASGRRPIVRAVIPVVAPAGIQHVFLFCVGETKGRDVRNAVQSILQYCDTSSIEVAITQKDDAHVEMADEIVDVIRDAGVRVDPATEYQNICDARTDAQLVAAVTGLIVVRGECVFPAKTTFIVTTPWIVGLFEQLFVRTDVDPVVRAHRGAFHPGCVTAFVTDKVNTRQWFRLYVNKRFRKGE